MKRKRTLLLVGLGFAATAATPAVATPSTDVAASVQEQAPSIQRLARIRDDYLKALAGSQPRDPDAVVAQYLPNFRNWANGWRNY